MSIKTFWGEFLKQERGKEQAGLKTFTMAVTDL